MVSEGTSRSDMYGGKSQAGYLGLMEANFVCSHILLESTKLVSASEPWHMQFPLSEMFFTQIFA